MVNQGREEEEGEMKERERGLGRALECDVEGRAVGSNETGGELGGGRCIK